MRGQSGGRGAGARHRLPLHSHPRDQERGIFL
jgi:hypothetical protein